MLASRHATGLSALYAKVLALEPPEVASAPTTVCLGFTVMAEDTKTFLAHTRTGGLQKEDGRPRYQSAGRDLTHNGTAPRTVAEGRTA